MSVCLPQDYYGPCWASASASWLMMLMSSPPPSISSTAIFPRFRLTDGQTDWRAAGASRLHPPVNPSGPGSSLLLLLLSPTIASN
ncbi:hypothetical protein EYF80_061758 [Liparis tanakae]|uniref:Uncharacterized protein n=1 Tax=Liparis tanakae TaxID=230148 RepID=A0A4Z2EH80_9TELE|nr:hypothetical protein EYF80_061758 [Liparis tanakae]